MACHVFSGELPDNNVVFHVITNILEINLEIIYYLIQSSVCKWQVEEEVVILFSWSSDIFYPGRRVVTCVTVVNKTIIRLYRNPGPVAGRGK